MNQDDGPLITVGIPFYNAVGTLADAIRSVFAQTYKHWELLLVDDGSTDGSDEIARGIRHERVRLIADGKHRGLVPRLNQIARCARGSLLARMDADDMMHPARLDREAREFLADSSLRLLASGCYSLGDGRRVIGIRGGHTPTAKSLLLGHQPIHPTVMMRTKWAQVNPYDASFPRAEDLELWCRSISHSRLKVLPAPLLFYDETSTVSVRKYVIGALTTDRILQRYGGSQFGPRSLFLLRGARLAKALVAALLVLLGLGNLLIRHRVRELNLRLLSDAAALLDLIRSTPLDPRYPTDPASSAVENRPPSNGQK